MNDDLIDDPQLKSVEQQLSASPPSISRQEKDRLLYACAFSAGQNAGLRSLRWWKVSSAALGILLACSTIPHFSTSLQMANQSPVPRQLSVRELQPETKSLPVVEEPKIPDLSAWALRIDNTELLEKELIALAKNDPHTRSLTVCALMRAEFRSLEQ